MVSIKRLLSGDNRDPRRELAEIFDTTVPSHGDVQPEALIWADGIIDQSAMSEVEAIHALRQAEPRLGLKSATYLAGQVFARS